MPKSEQVDLLVSGTLVDVNTGRLVDREIAVVDGEIVMQDREIESFDVNVDDILSRASETAADLVERTGFS
jgi:adenine deaminase